MLELFKRRPFKVRNADEYGLESVLNLFVSPLDGLTTPFEYENSIIKGRMGSGKTMYLRANHAYYLYGIVPSLLQPDSELILPVLIRLSDFQHIRQPDQIYRAVILKIVEELTSIYLRLQDAKQLAELHAGVRVLSDEMLSAHKLASSMRALARLGSEEYVERVTTELGLRGGVKHKFLEASAEWKLTNFAEFKKKANPGIKDIEECYKNLLEDQEGKILLLIDEAGSLDRTFFQGDTGSSFFEILMNQFRTASFIRTKIAVYPNSYSDMLTETRYGDAVRLEESVRDERGYARFHQRVVCLIENYLNPHGEALSAPGAADVFEMPLDSIYGGCLEQLLYASNGNMRRLIHLLDMAMNAAYVENDRSAAKVDRENALEALKEHATGSECLFTEQEKEFLEDLISACRSRGGFKFSFPNMSPVLYKYTSKSQEYNIVNIESLGAGRRGTIYAFDYSFAVLKDVPTHHHKDSEKIHRDRTLSGGVWIGRTIQINQEVIDQAALPGKLEGEVCYFSKKGGFIRSDAGEEFFFMVANVIESDQGKAVLVGKRVRFYPYAEGDSAVAAHVEIL